MPFDPLLAHIYFTIYRGILPDDEWFALVDLVDEIETNGQRSEYQLTRRVNIAGTAINWEGLFRKTAISLQKFAQILANEFDADIEDITITTEQIIYGEFPTVRATYIYGPQERFYLELNGCASDDDICSKEQSNDETIAMMAVQVGQWDEPI